MIPMVLMPSVKQFKLYQYDSKTMPFYGMEFDGSAVDGFLTARSDRDFSNLLNRYSATTYSLFGFKDDSEEGCVDLTCVDDFKNLQTLMRAGAMLLTIIRDPLSIYEDLNLLESLQGRTVASLDESDYLSEVFIPLLSTSETEKYLIRGLENRSPSFAQAVLQRISDESIILHLFPNPLTDNVKQKAMELFDALSSIMLGDVAMVVDNIQPVIVSNSAASSLWLTLMDTERRNAIIYCEECGTPCIAKPKRRNARRFCSDRCRQNHHRHP